MRELRGALALLAVLATTALPACGTVGGKTFVRAYAEGDRADPIHIDSCHDGFIVIVHHGAREDTELRSVEIEVP